MRILDFAINGQNLRRKGDFSGIVRGSKNYLRCRFNFEGSDWNGCKVAALFESNETVFPTTIDSNRTCTIPDEITDLSTFKIKIIGRKDNYQIVTNNLIICQEG